MVCLFSSVIYQIPRCLQIRLNLDEHGYIKTDITLTTNIPGVYVAGEAGDPNYRQVVTSAGMGAAAAMQAIKFLQEEENDQPIPVKS